MPGTPAQCLRCGHVFEDRSVDLQYVREANLTANTFTCPRCGGRAKGAEGKFRYGGPHEPPTIIAAPAETYALFGQLYRALRDIKPSREDVARLAELARARQHGQVEPEEAVREAAKIDTRFAVLFSPTAATWYGLVVAMFSLYLLLAWRAEDQAAEQEARDQQVRIEALLEREAKATEQMVEEIRRLAEKRADAG